MTIVSSPLKTQLWTFPTITNSYEGRVTGRKRVHDTGFERGRQLHRGSNKKAKTKNSTESASYDARAPHEFLAGDWRFEPPQEDTAPREEKNASPPRAVDVERVMTLLLQALNTKATNNRAEDKSMNSNSQHPRYVTSPLSGSPDRVPLVRKTVGGSCRGKVDPGLQKWVLCKNHYHDICAYHPSRRSAEWIEALHEMGWENLHPTYMSQSQQTFRTLTTFSASCNDWVEVYNADEYDGGESDKPGIDGRNGHVSESIHEDVWDSGLRAQSRAVTLIAA